jgi:hypothetical protein
MGRNTLTHYDLKPTRKMTTIISFGQHPQNVFPPKECRVAKKNKKKARL